MTDNKAVMEQALEALTNSVDLVFTAHAEAIKALGEDLSAHNAAIDALREALAQPTIKESLTVQTIAQPKDKP